MSGVTYLKDGETYFQPADVVLLASGRKLQALAARDGKPMWNASCGLGFKSPVDLFVAANLVWTGPAFAEGRDHGQTNYRMIRSDQCEG